LGQGRELTCSLSITNQRGNKTEAGCRIEKPWLAQVIFNRMDTYFNLQLSGSYALRIEVDEPYPHVIVGAPPNDPNQWILGFEDLNADTDDSDMDHNDMVFHIERKTGGTGRLISDQAITPAEADDYFTAVNFEVYDHIPGGSCRGETNITYYVSIDDGENWVEVRLAYPNHPAFGAAPMRKPAFMNREPKRNTQ